MPGNSKINAVFWGLHLFLKCLSRKVSPLNLKHVSTGETGPDHTAEHFFRIACQCFGPDSDRLDWLIIRTVSATPWGTVRRGVFLLKDFFLADSQDACAKLLSLHTLRHFTFPFSLYNIRRCCFWKIMLYFSSNQYEHAVSSLSSEMDHKDKKKILALNQQPHVNTVFRYAIL